MDYNLSELYLNYVSVQAMDYFGVSCQKIKAMDSLNNLIMNINYNSDVEEGIAKAEIMLHQLRLMYDSDKIKRIKNEMLEEIELSCIDI